MIMALPEYADMIAYDLANLYNDCYLFERSQAIDDSQLSSRDL